MLSKADKYQQIIQKATKRIMLFPNADRQEKKSIGTLQCNIKLPSSYPFRSSQQIQNNIPVTHQITHQSSQLYPTSLQNNWPKPCIGLVLCQHHQNNQTYYVYGTGILIHENIVLTSTQNVYCRRLNTQYTNVRFIVGVCGDKCRGIYDVMRVHYPKEYTMQEYENYNFAVLQLYNDLSNTCGYIGLKTSYILESKKLFVYGYINANQKGTFNLSKITKQKKQTQYIQSCLGSGVLVQENKDQQYSIVGLQQSEKKYILNEKIRNRINQWTEKTQIYIGVNDIDAQGCKYLSEGDWKHLTTIYLEYNYLGALGCKYLSQSNWTHLKSIYLNYNNIRAQGCKYLSQANWTYLTQKANWTHLKSIWLHRNNIGAQGCKYLSQANWKHLNEIILWQNNIDDIIYRLLLQQSYPDTKIYIQ